MRKRRTSGRPPVMDRLESGLLKAIICGFSLLVVTQAVMLQESGRALLSYVARVEEGGEPVGATALVRGRAGGEGGPGETVVVEVIGEKRDGAALLVNGIPVGRFREGRVEARVREGDVLQVDGRAYAARLRFRVVECSARVREPRTGLEVVTAGGLGDLGTVKLR